MSKFLADENFPFPSVKRLIFKGIDVIHVGSGTPSISDESVIRLGLVEKRIILTFDRDYGELIFGGRTQPPPGIVYFRLNRYRPAEPADFLLELLASGPELEGFFTVITRSGIRQRPL